MDLTFLELTKELDILDDPNTFLEKLEKLDFLKCKDKEEEEIPVESIDEDYIGRLVYS